jgi:molybdate/tungstate transport system substrate-binding protein
VTSRSTRIVPTRACLAGAAAAALVLAAGAIAGVAGVPPAGAGTKHAPMERSGTVIVLTAGSLETIMKTAVEPGFHKATGYTVTDVSGGSTGLAQDVKGGVHRADVFWSAAPTSDRLLMGSKNGNWVSWYLTFATTSLVLGYEPQDRFASSIRHGPWWKVVTEPGFRVGRTNPVTDPKGRLTVDALRKAARQHEDAALAAIATDTSTVFTETSLVGRLQAGQLDAGFFFAVEASAAHFPTVPLAGVSEKADYTLTVLAKAPHRVAAEHFVAWLLSPRAKRLLAARGLDELGTPVLAGRKSAVPASLRKVVG